MTLLKCLPRMMYVLHFALLLKREGFSELTLNLSFTHVCTSRIFVTVRYRCTMMCISFPGIVANNGFPSVSIQAALEQLVLTPTVPNTAAWSVALCV